ncbi:MAG: ATP-binding protein [bacterium]|nr:ATP-binding protein [bacterium]
MKNKDGQILPISILEDKPDALELLKDIKNLTVEDVVVIYAYAEAIVETVREPLVILDEQLRIKTANKSFFDTFKVNKKDTYNKLIFELGNEQWNIPSLKKLLTQLLPKSAHFKDYEVSHKFEDIGERTMILNARRIVLEGHKTELILLAIEDITDRKLIDKQKDDFIGIATHELKTPMTSIKSYIQILQKNNKNTVDKKNAFLLDKVASQVERMEHLMASFINVYKVQTGSLNLQKQHFSLDALIKEIVETFGYTTETHTIEYVGKIVTDIYTDREKIGQVLTNLLTNSIKYSPKADKVIVDVKKVGKKIIISVQDFGIGIPKEQQAKVFERFFRAKGKEEKGIHGLGLGLYIAYEIIKEHNGKMWVDSKDGKGSTFYFSLPINN